MLENSYNNDYEKWSKVMNEVKKNPALVLDLLSS